MSATKESAVLLSLESLSKELTSQTVAWFTDNQNVASIIEKGSNKSDLQEITDRVRRFGDILAPLSMKTKLNMMRFQE